MATQDGLIKIKGAVDELTFRRSRKGHSVYKTPEGPTKEEIATGRQYERVRENMDEFGRAAESSKLFRLAMNELLIESPDTGLITRLTQKMMEVLVSDHVSDRGKRDVMNGNLSLFKNFVLNSHAKQNLAFKAVYSTSIDRVSGKLLLDIPAFIPRDVITGPAGSTHLKIISAALEINFATGATVKKIAEAAPVKIDDKDPVREIIMEHEVSPNSTNPLFLVFGTRFLQEVNGKFYQLFNKAFNVLVIVDAV